jgi:hypothetical protein
MSDGPLVGWRVALFLNRGPWVRVLPIADFDQGGYPRVVSRNRSHLVPIEEEAEDWMILPPGEGEDEAIERAKIGAPGRLAEQRRRRAELEQQTRDREEQLAVDRHRAAVEASIPRVELAEWLRKADPGFGEPGTAEQHVLHLLHFGLTPRRGAQVRARDIVDLYSAWSAPCSYDLALDRSALSRVLLNVGLRGEKASGVYSLWHGIAIETDEPPRPRQLPAGVSPTDVIDLFFRRCVGNVGSRDLNLRLDEALAGVRSWCRWHQISVPDVLPRGPRSLSSWRRPEKRGDELVWQGFYLRSWGPDPAR